MNVFSLPAISEIVNPVPDLTLERSADGYWFDPDTGEIFGHEDLETSDAVLQAIAGSDTEQHRFEVTNLAEAEWVLEKILEAESVTVGLMARRDAILANIDSQIKASSRRVDYLHSRFAADLEAFAAQELLGRKERTIGTPYGKMSFRRVAGGISARDTDRAIEWAEANAPAAVVISKKLHVAPLKGREDELPADIFEVRPQSDSFSINTGVK